MHVDHRDPGLVLVLRFCEQGTKKCLALMHELVLVLHLELPLGAIDIVHRSTPCECV